MSNEEMKERIFSIIDDKKYVEWKKRYRIDVGVYPVGGIVVEKGDNEMELKCTDEEFINLLENSVSNNKDLVSPVLKKSNVKFSFNQNYI